MYPTVCRKRTFGLEDISRLAPLRLLPVLPLKEAVSVYTWRAMWIRGQS
jgi:hypothetical protein